MSSATGPWVDASKQLPDDGVCLVQYTNGDFGVVCGDSLKHINQHAKTSSAFRVVRWAKIATSRDAWTSNRQARPEAAGEYWVTLDAPETVNVAPAGEPYRFEPTGRMIRTLDTRYLAAPGEDDGWTMDGEDVSDYHWTEQTGSREGEHVVAWMGPIEPPEMYLEELTDGYEYVWEGEA